MKTPFELSIEKVGAAIHVVSIDGREWVSRLFRVDVQVEVATRRRRWSSPRGGPPSSRAFAPEQRIDWDSDAEPLPFRTESVPSDRDPRRSLEAFAALQVDLIGEGASADVARRYGLEPNDLVMVERQWMRHFQTHADDARRFRRLVAERHQRK